jgi:hypothetical protein
MRRWRWRKGIGSRIQWVGWGVVGLEKQPVGDIGNGLGGSAKGGW